MTPGIFKIGGDYSDIASSYSRNVAARRKATNDAWDKYYNDQIKSIDPNSVRPQDREAFDAMFNEWKQVGIANKKTLLSNPAAKREHEAMLTEISRFAQDSKGRTASKEPLLRMIDGPNRNKINEGIAFKAIDAHDAPLRIKDASGKWINNPNSVSIDYKQNFWNPKPIDLPKFFQDASFGKKQIETLGTPIRPDKSTDKGRALLAREEMIQPIRTEYTYDTKKEIAENAFKLAQLDPDLNDAFEVEFKNIKKEDFDALTKTLQSYFPGQEIKSGADLAKATALQLAEKQDFDKEDVIADKERIRLREQQEERERERKADRRAAMRAGDDEPSVNVYDVIDVGIPAGFNGTFNVPNSKVPPKLRLAMKGIGYEPGFNGVDLSVKDGKIMGASPSGFAGGLTKPTAMIDRNDILIGQKKAGTKINWGGSKQSGGGGSKGKRSGGSGLN